MEDSGVANFLEVRKESTVRKHLKASEMGQWLKALASKLDTEFDPQDSQGERREPSPRSCPLTSIRVW